MEWLGQQQEGEGGVQVEGLFRDPKKGDKRFAGTGMDSRGSLCACVRECLISLLYLLLVAGAFVHCSLLAFDIIMGRSQLEVPRKPTQRSLRAYKNLRCPSPNRPQFRFRRSKTHKIPTNLHYFSRNNSSNLLRIPTPCRQQRTSPRNTRSASSRPRVNPSSSSR